MRSVQNQPFICYNLFLNFVDNPESMPLYKGTDEKWMRHKPQTQPQQNQGGENEKNNVQLLNELYNQIQFICDEPKGPLL